MKPVAVIILLMFAFAPTDSHARLNEVSLLSIEASKAAVAGDYRKAITYYNRLIQLKPNDANHYIERGLMFRKLKRTSQSQRDGQAALKIAEQRLKKRSSRKRTAKYYWQRAMAYRLMGQYDQAKADIRNAMKLRRDQRWLPDLQAIELEAKMHSGATR